MIDLLLTLVTLAELLIIFRIRFIYSRQPIAAIAIVGMTISGFYVLAMLVVNNFIRAYTFSFATVDLVFLIIMLLYMVKMKQDLKKLPALKQTDFLIVLGNKCMSSHVPPILSGRLDKAIELYSDFSQKPRIIVSGGKSSKTLDSEAAMMKEYLIDAGIPEQMIVTEEESYNTVQNLEYSAIKIKQIWHKDSRPRVMIVTSDYHIPRTKWHATKLGLRVNFAASRTVQMLKWPAMFREFTAISWYHRYQLMSILGMDVLFSLSMCM